VPNVNVANLDEVVTVLNEIKERIPTAKELAKASSERRRKDMTEAFVEGSIVVDTYVKLGEAESKVKNEEDKKRVRELQNDLLLKHGVQPKKISQLHNPTGSKSDIRQQSVKISNDAGQRRKKDEGSKKRKESES